MARRAIFLAILVLLPGCGAPTSSLTERGLTELRSGQYDAAIATCTEALQLDARDDAALLYRGRAHHYRNGKGDPQRAIADFTKAIEIAPKSSDAYYSRALVYHDLGQTDLAAADDNSARSRDGRLQQLSRQLPDPTLVPKEEPKAAEPIPAETQATSDAAPEPKEKPEDLYRFGKESPQGDLPKDPRATAESKEKKRSSFDRYRERLAKPAVSGDEPGSRTSGAPVTAIDPRLAPPMSAQGPGAAPANPNQRRIYRPAPSSPFLPPGQSATGSSFAPGYAPPGQSYAPGYTPGGFAPQSPYDGRVRSPFPQRAPAPTGRQPTNPFGPQPIGGQTPPPNGDPNSLIRPPNPRDYVP